MFLSFFCSFLRLSINYLSIDWFETWILWRFDDFMYCIIILCFSYLATWLPFFNKPIDWLIDWYMTDDALSQTQVTDGIGVFPPWDERTWYSSFIELRSVMLAWCASDSSAAVGHAVNPRRVLYVPAKWHLLNARDNRPLDRETSAFVSDLCFPEQSRLDWLTTKFIEDAAACL